MNFRSYEDLARIISNNIYKIPEDVDLVVGVPRSGLMAASMVALYLNLPITDIEGLEQDRLFESGSTKKGNWIKKPSKARKILVVEDSSVSGNSINQVKERLSKLKIKNKLIYLIVIATKETKDLADMYFDICPVPRMFEWNYMYHILLRQACVDIDGVLNRDPSEEENDDGEKYIDFISNVKPRVVPTKKIKYLVTTRLEKYRKYTEAWLKKNHIEYEQLIMMDVASKEERVKLGNHGIYKGNVYKGLDDAIIFIESNKNQAQVIANTSGKPAFCVDNGKLYKPQPKVEVKKEEPRKKSSIVRRAFRKVVPLRLRKALKKKIGR